MDNRSSKQSIDNFGIKKQNIILFIFFSLFVSLSFANIAFKKPLSLQAPFVTFSVTTLQGLTFPTQDNSFQGHVVVAPSDNGSAIFSSTGPAGRKATAKVLRKNIQLNFAGSNVTLKATIYQYGGDLNQNGRFNYPSGQGQTTRSNLRFGATLTIPSGVVSGLYQGTAIFQVKINKTKKRTSFPVSVEILASHHIEFQQAMIFPPQLEGFSGHVILDPQSQDAGCAEFSVTGTAGSAAIAQVTTTTVNLKKTGTTQHISVTNFRFGGYPAGHIDPVSGRFNFPASQGSQESTARGILIGATATYPSNLPTGNYQGIATLRITYQ